MRCSVVEMQNRTLNIIGGGTISHVRNHLALCAPAYGTTARTLAHLCERRWGSTIDVVTHLTKMAEPSSWIETNDDVFALTGKLTADPLTKIVFFNPALVDFRGSINGLPSGKYGRRLLSADPHFNFAMELHPEPKILPEIRRERKDIFLVGFKTTTEAPEEIQYRAGLNLLKSASCNLVLANDVVTSRNMIIVPEEAAYSVTFDRQAALQELVEITYLRSHLTFTRSTVVAGSPVPWETAPPALRAVVDYCILRGAYKRFRGVTAGHFAVKLNDTTFLTSRRKTDFNDMRNVGLVRIETDGPDSVIAYGSKPSVGGQSQRIVFEEHPGEDCIVHFHCPIKPGSEVPIVSQREYECGSHECGRNTSRGLKRFGNILAVYLDQHGPNLVFHQSIDSLEVIGFIEANFDLQEKTGGFGLA